MAEDSEFSSWAAQFLVVMEQEQALPDTPSPTVADAPYAGLTAAAGALLRSVDDGGVPAFVTHNLRQIALENGVDVGVSWTPNQIIEALRDISRKSK